MEAIILAGGLGTRLKGHTNGLPKPMVSVAGRPFLEIILDKLVAAGFQRVCLAVSYKADVIKKHFFDEYKGLSITYSTEDVPLGTGGAIKKAISQLGSSNIFVLNGDTFVDVDYRQLLKFHIRHQADLSITSYQMNNYDRYGTVISNKYNKVIDFHGKKLVIKGNINAGTYILKRTIFDNYEIPLQFSFEADFMEKYVNSIREFSFSTTGYFIDIGVPEDLERANKELIHA